jgi:hypothetical protein
MSNDPQPEESFYAGLARRFVECRDYEHAILFLTVGCTAEDTPGELLTAVADCNIFLAVKDRDEENTPKGEEVWFRGDAWTDLYLKAVDRAAKYYVSVYPDRPEPSAY